MLEPKYEEGDEFDLGADGQVRIKGVYEIRESNDKILYEVEYLDQPGEQISPVSEKVLEEVN